MRPDSSRIIVCVSDHTGLTAEAFAHSLVARFDGVDVTYDVRPFVDTVEKVDALVAEIDVLAASGERPIVFSTLTDPALWVELRRADALVLTLFEHFVEELSEELGIAPAAPVGAYHRIRDMAAYQVRLDAVDFALQTDDGIGIHHYGSADAILVGVSRVGKTPTCLYMSMHYGIRAANYPLTEEDFTKPGLPAPLRGYEDRLYGLTIDPQRLRHIRQKRRPDSDYSAVERCRWEVQNAEQLFGRLGVPVINTSALSIEEITATIITERQLERRVE